MAAFASCRRSGWVRFLVVLLCALFVFATLGAPAARAEALTVGLFTVAAVLSAATAALGFKLANSADGQATLAKMVKDFKTVAWATGFVLVGSKINGLIDGVDYIKMQVKAGKTYLDERVVAWVQQWLAINGVYDDSSIVVPDVPSLGESVSFVGGSLSDMVSYLASNGFESSVYAFNKIISEYNLTDANTSGALITAAVDLSIDYIAKVNILYPPVPDSGIVTKNGAAFRVSFDSYYYDAHYYRYSPRYDKFKTGTYNNNWCDIGYFSSGSSARISNYSGFDVSSNNTGLSGTDTIGKDVVDKSLDDVLAGLKEWAPDWWDAGADSSTNGAAAGAKDLPLNMGSDVKTVTGNPALDVDQPLIYTPWFEQDVGQLRNGETAGTVTNTATSAADTADKAEAAQGTVDDAQGVVQSIISWGLDYISPDKGLFSRFPLCIPYDAYLLVTAALGVDAQDLGDIVGQSPGELSAQVDDGVAVQSDFVPVISVKHDWTQDGVTTPVEFTIDLRPYDAVIKMIRTLVSVYVIAELIASEYKRIRGS